MILRLSSLPLRPIPITLFFPLLLLLILIHTPKTLIPKHDTHFPLLDISTRRPLHEVIQNLQHGSFPREVIIGYHVDPVARFARFDETPVFGTVVNLPSVHRFRKFDYGELPNPNVRHGSGDFIQTTLNRQPAQDPNAILRILTKCFQHVQRVRGRFMRRIPRPRSRPSNPQRILIIEQDKPSLGVLISRPNEGEIEWRYGGWIALLMFEMDSDAAVEEGGDECLGCLGVDVTVEVLYIPYYYSLRYK
jgi:hypothetical protein